MDTDCLLLHAIDALVFSRLPTSTEDWSILTACIHPRHFIRLVFDKITTQLGSELLRPSQLAACLEALNLSKPTRLDSICFSLNDFEHILCKQYCLSKASVFRAPPMGNIADICFEDLMSKLKNETMVGTSSESLQVLNCLDRLQTAASFTKSSSGLDEDLIENLARENLIRTIVQQRSELNTLKTVVQDLSLKLQIQDAEKIALMVKHALAEKESKSKYKELEKRNEKLKRRLHHLIVSCKSPVCPRAMSKSPIDQTQSMSISLASQVLLNGQVWHRTDDHVTEIDDVVVASQSSGTALADAMVTSQSSVTGLDGVMVTSQSSATALDGAMVTSQSSGTSTDEISELLDYDSSGEVDSPPPSDPCSSSFRRIVSKSLSSPAANSVRKNVIVEPVLMPLKPSSSLHEFKSKLNMSTLSRKIRQAESCLIRAIAPIKHLQL